MRTTRHTEAHTRVIINTAPGHPSAIARTRFIQDAKNAADVKLLVCVVLGCETDGLLHYDEHGTSVVLRPIAQTLFWGSRTLDTAPLTGLVKPVNHWLKERVEISEGRRAVESRIAKSDAALDELGYPALHDTLLRVAKQKPKNIQILDDTGRGGVLEIPSKGQIIGVHKTDERIPLDDAEEILGIAYYTQIVNPSGALFETHTACVSNSVVEGGRVRVRSPRRTSSRSRRATAMEVVQQGQEPSNDKE